MSHITRHSQESQDWYAEQTSISYNKRINKLEKKIKKLEKMLRDWLNWTYYLPDNWKPVPMIEESKEILKGNE